MIRKHLAGGAALVVILAASDMAIARQRVSRFDGIGPYVNTGVIGENRGLSAAALLNDVVYIAGGESRSGEGGSKLLEAYDTVDNEIVRRKDMLVARERFAMVPVDGKLYAIGGVNLEGELNSVHEYDPKTDHWKVMAPMGEPRSDFSAAVVDGIIYAVGGWNGKKFTTTVEAFDPKKNKWTTTASLLAPVASRDSLAVVGGMLYLVGGLNQTYFQQVQVYNPKADVWAIESDLPVDVDQMLSVEAVGDVIYAFTWSRSSTTYLAYSTGSGYWTKHVRGISSPIGHFAVSDSSGTIYGPGSGVSGIRAYRPRADFISGKSRRGLVYRPSEGKVIAASDSVLDQNLTPVKERPNDFAVIIGIEKYGNVAPADYAENDARLFKKYAVALLGIPEKNAILLTGNGARLADITKYVEEWLPRNATPESRVYFFYSGHGAPDPQKGGSYLVPWDGDPAYLASSGYAMRKLYDKLESLRAKDVVVFLDACFSGEGSRSVMARGLRPLVILTDTPVTPRSKLSILTAARVDEVAGGIEDQGHGMFTYYLLRGIRGDAAVAPSGRVSLGRLHDYIQKNVQRDARRQNRDQTPQMFSASAGLMLRD
jgi:N-acetylneuraminic acid mutarotase